MFKVSNLNSDDVEKILREFNPKMEYEWVEFNTNERFRASYMKILDVFYKANEKLFCNTKLYFYEYLELLGIKGPALINARNDGSKWDIYLTETFQEAWIYPEYFIKTDDETGEIILGLDTRTSPQ